LSAEEDVSLATCPNDAKQMGKKPKEPETGAWLGHGGKLWGANDELFKILNFKYLAPLNQPGPLFSRSKPSGLRACVCLYFNALSVR
jgi:hypothetical protein